MVNKVSYYSTLFLLTGVMMIFVAAPIIGIPSFGAVVISLVLAILSGLVIVEYSRRFSPD